MAFQHALSKTGVAKMMKLSDEGASREEISKALSVDLSYVKKFIKPVIKKKAQLKTPKENNGQY